LAPDAHDDGMTGVPPWRGVVNGVLYQVQFAPDLDAALVDTAAASMIARPLYDQPLDLTVDAMRAALTGREPLTGGIPQPHDEAAVRDFFAALVARLDALRPWPVPPFRGLDAQDRPDLLDAPVIAHLRADWKQISDRLHRMMHHVGAHAVLVLELAGGETFAIIDEWDLRTGNDRQSEVRYAGTLTPTEALAEFVAATNFDPADVRAI
jgi:hypothetical protein